MSCDSSWLSLAEASTATFARLDAKPFDVVELSMLTAASAGSYGGGFYKELTTCLVQLVPRRSHSTNDNELFLHHVLYDCLMESSEMLGVNQGVSIDHTFKHDMSIRPITPYPGMICTNLSELEKASSSNWQLTRVKVGGEFDSSITTIELQCLLIDEEIIIDNSNLNDIVRDALQGRWLMAGTTMVLAVESDETLMIVVVRSVNGSHEKIAYRLKTSDTFQVAVTMLVEEGFADETGTLTEQNAISSCPGYEGLVDSILQLLSIQGESSPSGLLLQGCAGVGKTRLLQCVGNELQTSWNVHYISLQDMLLQASWSSEEVLLKKLMPVKASDRTVCFIDDLDVLQLDEGSDEMHGLDHERRLLLNCVLQAIDRLVALNSTIIGAGQNSSSLPSFLLKAGRLEKNVDMLPPTQRQRELILCHLLRHADYDDSICLRWCELLASATAGCVASDLHRLAADAFMNAIDEAVMPTWDHWKDAARACLPSQLASLDVTKAVLYFDEGSSLDWLTVHNESWKSFCGHESLKKRVFRTVVAPWRRHLERSAESNRSKTIDPPSGVLFHGNSGCGKTLAATCLGSSLGLPMIKVRAADVLDKWLGGSEATIRSLFSRARAAAPCVLFFDEIDSIAHNRGTSDESTDVMSRLLSTLLNEMDGVSSGINDNILVVACTNRLDALDAALLRPGRLEEHIELLLPTPDDALKMLEHQFSRVPLEDDVDLCLLAYELAEKTVTAADLEGIARESVFRSLRRDSDTQTVQKSDVLDAINILKL